MKLKGDLSYIVRHVQAARELVECTTRVIFGINTAQDVRIEMNDLGGKRTFIVTDKGIIRAGLLGRVEKALADRCVGVFSEIPQDTVVRVVNRAAEIARELKVDSLVSLGGGSMIDTYQRAGRAPQRGGRLEDYQGMQMLTGPQNCIFVSPPRPGPAVR